MFWILCFEFCQIYEYFRTLHFKNYYLEIGDWIYLYKNLIWTKFKIWLTKIGRWLFALIQISLWIRSSGFLPLKISFLNQYCQNFDTSYFIRCQNNLLMLFYVDNSTVVIMLLWVQVILIWICLFLSQKDYKVFTLDDSQFCRWPSYSKEPYVFPQAMYWLLEYHRSKIRHYRLPRVSS